MRPPAADDVAVRAVDAALARMQVVFDDEDRAAAVATMRSLLDVEAQLAAHDLGPQAGDPCS